MVHSLDSFSIYYKVISSETYPDLASSSSTMPFSNTHYLKVSVTQLECLATVAAGWGWGVDIPPLGPAIKASADTQQELHIYLLHWSLSLPGLGYRWLC